MNAAPHQIIIVGGGTAGWMSACFLAKAWQGRPCTITLLESDTIGTVGVGEGSTPYLRQFFAFLGIAETEWMPACSATYKLGISFEGWNSPSTDSAYFHPFFSELDIPTADSYFAAVNQRRQGVSADVNPAHYFSAAHMVKHNYTPDKLRTAANLDYAYHFDAGLLATFLKQYAGSLGVVHKVGTVYNVIAADDHVSAIETPEHGVLNADMFVDCSGFSGLLAKKALARPFVSYADTLFNDAAVAMPTMQKAAAAMQAQTRSVALKNGWQWEIPLTSRTGNGYVYSTRFCNSADAEAELRETLGLKTEATPARHLRIQVGRLRQHWQGNCLAIGLSQGFIEPLEATALMLVQYALHHFVDCWDLATPQPRQQQLYNDEINRMFDGIRDYIAAHYLLNTRDDSAYWRACRHEMKVPDTLAFLVDAWDSGANFEQALNEVDDKLVYIRPSWYCILAGMHRFTKPAALAHPNQQAITTVEHTLKRYF